MKAQLHDYIKTLRKNDPDYSAIVKKIKFTQKSNLEKFIYYYKVWKHTEQNKTSLDNINKRGLNFHLDHIIPISIGYKYNINPSLIGDKVNLRIISSKDNISKGSKITDDTIRVLLEFGINLEDIPPYRKDIISLAAVPKPDVITTDNKHSLLYYLEYE